MNQEKFVNSYIELLNATLTEAIQKNLVIQTQKKIVEEELREKIISENEKINIINSKQKEIDGLKDEINHEKKINQNASFETFELKKNVQHVDTFKNELIKARQQIEKLNAELEEKNNLIEKMKKEKSSNKKVKPKSIVVIEGSDLDVEEQVSKTIKDAGNF